MEELKFIHVLIFLIFPRRTGWVTVK